MTEWLTQAAVRARLQLTRYQVEKLTRQGRLRRREIDGEWRWDPTYVDAVAEELARGERPEYDEREEQDDPEIVSAYREQTHALRIAQTHVESLLRLVTTPAQEQLRMLQGDLAAARQRIAELEAKFDETIKLREQMLSEAQQRELAAESERRREERRDRILRLAEQRAIPLLDRWLEHDGKAATAMRLLGSLDPKMIEALIGSGLLTEEQQKMLRELFPEAASESKEANGAARAT